MYPQIMADGARNAAMMHSGVANTDVWSAVSNPGSMGMLENSSVGLSYENRYFIEELGCQTLVTTIHTRSGNFGAHVSQFGYSLYSQTQTGISYGKTLGKRVSAGIGFIYENVHISEGYGNAGNALIHAGINITPLNDFSLGVHIYNPTFAKLDESGNFKIPSYIEAGLSYHYKNIFTLCFEGTGVIKEKTEVSLGLEYIILKHIALRCGAATNPARYSFGLGTNMARFNVDLAFSVHQVLGMTSQLGISYNFKNKKL
jgi:hypothetical protein